MDTVSVKTGAIRTTLPLDARLIFATAAEFASRSELWKGDDSIDDRRIGLILSWVGQEPRIGTAIVAANARLERSEPAAATLQPIVINLPAIQGRSTQAARGAHFCGIARAG